MSNDSDWYARRLGNPQPQQRNYPPTHIQQVPAPTYSPQQQPQQPQQGGRTVETIYEAAQYWQGGEAHRTERNSCPRCGGQHYYSRSQGIARGPSPAPMCFDCGYNGMFDQGDPGTWGATG